MGAREHVAVVERIVAAVNRRDLDEVERLVDPGFVVDYSRSRGLYRGVYRGASAARRAMEDGLDAWAEVRWHPQEIRTVGDELVLVDNRATFRASSDDLVVEGRACQVWRFRDGTPVAMTLFQSLPEAVAELRSVDADV